MTTGADGLTTVFWLPDANTATPTQQLTATLIVPDNSTLKPPGTLRFTANLRVGGHGTCCCLTVGPDGDFRTLAEAFKRLLGKLDDICLCLLPGPHEVNGLEIKPINEKDMVNVHIAGCGAGSVIKLTKRPLVAMALNSFVLRNLSLEAVEVASPLRFRDCREVKFQDCHVATSTLLTTLVTIAGADRVVVQNCVLESWFFFWNPIPCRVCVVTIAGLKFPTLPGVRTPRLVTEATAEITTMLARTTPETRQEFVRHWTHFLGGPGPLKRTTQSWATCAGSARKPS